MPHLRLLRRSVDARSREIKVNVEVEVSQNEPITEVISYKNLVGANKSSGWRVLPSMTKSAKISPTTLANL